MGRDTRFCMRVCVCVVLSSADEWRLSRLFAYVATTIKEAAREPRVFGACIAKEHALRGSRSKTRRANARGARSLSKSSSRLPRNPFFERPRPPATAPLLRPKKFIRSDAASHGWVDRLRECVLLILISREVISDGRIACPLSLVRVSSAQPETCVERTAPVRSTRVFRRASKKPLPADGRCAASSGKFARASWNATPSARRRAARIVHIASQVPARRDRVTLRHPRGMRKRRRERKRLS